MDTFYSQEACDRCGGSLRDGRTMSIFNKQCICIDCAKKEKLRNDYYVAYTAEREAVRYGNRNFRGIGLGECFSDSLRHILPVKQRWFIEELLNSEIEDTRLEGKGVLEAAERQAKAFEAMPKTYETDGQGKGKGDDAIVYLHYFSPFRGGDWWITERDVEERQIQAFGLVRLFCVELGYIDLEELQTCPYIELDFYWRPRTLREIRQEIGEE